MQEKHISAHLSPKKQLDRIPHCLHYLYLPFQQSLATPAILFLQELCYLYMRGVEGGVYLAIRVTDVIIQGLMGTAVTSVSKTAEAPS